MSQISHIDWSSLRLDFPENNNPLSFRGLGDSFSAPQDANAEPTSALSSSVSIADIENDDSYVAVLGDIHGDDVSLKIVIEACKQAGIKHLFQVGDFGYLFHQKSDREELSRDPSDRLMDEMLKEAYDDFGLTLHVIDGNHDNHALYHRGQSSREPRRITDKWDDAELPSMPTYHPRGNVEVVDFKGGFDTTGEVFNPFSVQFGFMGGARSVNVPPREEKMREGWDFWFDEEPTDEDVTALIENMNSVSIGDNVDGNTLVNKILLTHEAATDYYLRKGLVISNHMEALSARTRNRVAQVVNETNPSLHIHGHWHQLATGVYDGYKGRSNLLCLAEERRPGNLVFVNMRTHQVWVPQGYVEWEEPMTPGHLFRVL